MNSLPFIFILNSFNLIYNYEFYIHLSVLCSVTISKCFVAICGHINEIVGEILAHKMSTLQYQFREFYGKLWPIVWNGISSTYLKNIGFILVYLEFFFYCFLFPFIIIIFFFIEKTLVIDRWKCIPYILVSFRHIESL